MESDIDVQVTERRSGGYLPTVWDLKFIDSFSTSHTYDSDGGRLEELKQAARCLFTSVNGPDEKLDMIDKMQRLDISKYFHKEINEFLTHLNPNAATDLFTLALRFRILRQHGFFVTPDVFKKFMDSDGKFKENLSEDVRGLLSLYEASYLNLGLHGEDDVLEEANTFTTKHLKLATENLEDKDLAQQIKESLEVPLYRRLPRMEARNFINIYQRDGNNSTVLLELAKLDFNLLQSVYLQELKELAQWWAGLKMKEKVPFARDRMVECYFWAMGSVPDPKFYKCRRNLTKYGSLATVLDDVYDIYGSMDELIKYTTAVERWDVEAIEDLPEYMRVCYKAMHDHVNEMVEDALNAHGLNILPYIKDQWVCYVQSLHTEAEWYYGGYMPTLDQHLQNSWISIGIAVGLAFVFLALLEDSGSLHHSQWQFFDHWSDSDLFYLPSLITRLLDDLTTSKVEMERGEITNSIQCYMIQEGVSEEEASDHIKGLINDSWKQLNKLVVDPSLPTGFAKFALLMTRCVQRMYQFGDWFGIQSTANRDCVSSSLFNRI
ncbi:3R-linalool synthase, putative isoform 2 [Hibiscus syriacus]|uniref:(+)-delta-cadinene synthase n=1 Tax=Hibiscus syriacus TaxID=106335 RepID=A0A6A2ZP12_HIBSY|nr:probable terpene synthase 9 [Hibiscus syriacus]KAE8693523.1 3R-linalool synthase, putative isoform 2 [Hibiscus syriacus]